MSWSLQITIWSSKESAKKTLPKKSSRRALRVDRIYSAPSLLTWPNIYSLQRADRPFSKRLISLQRADISFQRKRLFWKKNTSIWGTNIKPPWGLSLVDKYSFDVKRWTWMRWKLLFLTLRKDDTINMLLLLRIGWQVVYIFKLDWSRDIPECRFILEHLL